MTGDVDVDGGGGGGKRFWARQPGAALYTAYTAVRLLLVQLPGLVVQCAVPRFRPVREWTFQQALGRAVTRAFFEYAAVVELSPPQTHDPGAEGDRFVTMPPFLVQDGTPAAGGGGGGGGHRPLGGEEPDSPSRKTAGSSSATTTTTTATTATTDSIYHGVAAPTAAIRPVTVGGTWHPAPLQPQDSGGRRRVFLHFHGGAYVVFDCRDRDMGFGARLLLQASSGKREDNKDDDSDADADADAAVLCPQYRLASHGGRFPAALQDAITAYAHVVLRLGVPARDVVLSGDSAGGNLALALLRYLECGGGQQQQKQKQHGRHLPLPPPGGVLLWSPWTDLTVSAEALAARAEDRFDLVPPRLVEWAYRVFLPRDRDGDGDGDGDVRDAAAAAARMGTAARACENPYISPVVEAIRTDVPIWVQVGGKEIIRRDILRWVEVQRAAGTRVRVFEIAHAPHDMFMAGEGLGFVRECREAAEDAIRFLDGRV